MPPFNGSGTFDVYTPGNPVITGTAISSTAFNNTINDMASGLSNTLTRDGQAPAIADIPMGSHKITGLASGTATTDAANFGQAGQLGAYLPAGTGAVATTVQTKLRECVSVKDFGAVGDFNPATGVGTDDRASIQAAFDYAISIGNCDVIFPHGNYYLGTGYGIYSALGVQLNLGTTTAGSASNIHIIGKGATLYQGAAGRAFGIFGASNVTFSGFKFYGYTGGTLASTRENDALLTVNYYSTNVTIEDCYLTNSLGDCIYLGGSLVSGGELGYECRNISIRNNTLKERYGDGTASFSSGTKSRLCVAAIDVYGALITDNTIYGGIDLEPNLNSQHIVNVSINDNKFLSGNVTAQSVIGTAYWHDEPINTTGGSVIAQDVSFNGVPASPICSGNVVTDNTFEYGFIYQYNVYLFNAITSNNFISGQINTGSTSGSNSSPYVYIADNVARSPLSGETCFIKLGGYHTYGNFVNNRAINGFTYCINNNGASTGDNGRCSFIGNSIDTGTAVLGLTLASTSTESGSVNNGSATNPAKFSYIYTDTLIQPLVTITGTTGAQAISWATYKGNVWYITIPSTTAGSISNITGALFEGQMLTIISGAAGGGGSLTFTQGNFRNKGSVDAVLLGNQVITFVSRAGLWFEVSRGF
jgi:hypothetical protein